MDDFCDCLVGCFTGNKKRAGFISDEERYAQAKARMAANGHGTDTLNPHQQQQATVVMVQPMQQVGGMPPPPPPPPPGAANAWQPVVDPSSGKTYYYNAATNQTSWTPM